jgi:hypothetical protein
MGGRFDASSYGLPQRDFPRVAGYMRAHAIGDIGVTDPGLRIGEAERAAGARKAAGLPNSHASLGFMKPSENRDSPFIHLSQGVIGLAFAGRPGRLLARKYRCQAIEISDSGAVDRLIKREEPP